MNCSPIARNTPSSRTNCTVRQLGWSLIRGAGAKDRAPRGPVTRPAATAASTPDAPSWFAGRNAMKGTVNEIAVVSTGSEMRARIATVP